MKTDKQPDQFIELGSTGVPAWSGMIRDDFQQELTGPMGRRTYREMESDPTIGACLGAIKQRLRSVPIKVVPGTEDNEGMRQRDLVETALADMQATWADTLTDFLSMLTYGWEASEPVFKHRTGDTPTIYRDESGVEIRSSTSRYNDGLVGWDGFPIRRQETLVRWDLNGGGGVRAMVQQVLQPVAKQVTIPEDRLLLFRTESNRGNVEGRSIMRAAYVPWYCSKRIRVFEGIGIERELTGLPVIEIPGDITTDTAKAAQFESFKQMGRNVRADEQGCVIIPSNCWPGTSERMYRFSLAASGGKRQIDAGTTIGRLNIEMMLTMFCDFLMLGHSKSGTRSLGETKDDTFSLAISGWLDSILEIMNRKAIPRLLVLNGFRTEAPPRMVANRVEAQDLTALGSYLTAMGGVFPEMALVPGLMDAALQAGNLPTSEGAQEVGKRAASVLSTLGLTEFREAKKAANEVLKALKKEKEKPVRGRKSNA